MCRDGQLGSFSQEKLDGGLSAASHGKPPSSQLHKDPRTTPVRPRHMRCAAVTPWRTDGCALQRPFCGGGGEAALDRGEASLGGSEASVGWRHASQRRRHASARRSQASIGRRQASRRRRQASARSTAASSRSTKASSPSTKASSRSTEASRCLLETANRPDVASGFPAGGLPRAARRAPWEDAGNVTLVEVLACLSCPRTESNRHPIAGTGF
jgi:hypothetical protein